MWPHLEPCLYILKNYLTCIIVKTWENISLSLSTFPPPTYLPTLENIPKEQSEWRGDKDKDKDMACQLVWNCWHFRPLRTWIDDNHCDLTIKSDTGQHSQFLWWFQDGFPNLKTWFQGGHDHRYSFKVTPFCGNQPNSRGSIGHVWSNCQWTNWRDLQSSEDAWTGYTSQKHTLEKYTGKSESLKAVGHSFQKTYHFIQLKAGQCIMQFDCWLVLIAKLSGLQIKSWVALSLLVVRSFVRPSRIGDISTYLHYMMF